MFQMIRGNAGEPTYGGDYEEIQKLKRIADSQRVSILLVHHLRKQGDRDPINKLSGTTGITGAVDQSPEEQQTIQDEQDFNEFLAELEAEEEEQGFQQAM